MLIVDRVAFIYFEMDYSLILSAVVECMNNIKPSYQEQKQHRISGHRSKRVSVPNFSR